MKVKNNLSPKKTKEILEKEFGIKDLSVKDRTTYIKTIRHLYSYFSMQKKSVSYAKSARIINRDHATVFHGEKFIINAISINNKQVMPLYERALNVIKLHQKHSKQTIEEIYEYHIKEAQKAKEQIEVLKLEKKQLVEKIKPHNLKTKEAQKLADNLITKSVEDFILRRKINNWLSTKKSTDLLECTKHIEYNHSENFNVFSELHRSIQL